MQVTVTTIIFGLPEGQRILRLCLSLPMRTMVVSELIAYKVRQEVADYRAYKRPGLSGEYLSPEALINTPSRDALVPGEADDEIARAQRAFAHRDFMIVIDDQRIFDPGAVVTLSPETRVEFIKILPLVGG